MQPKHPAYAGKGGAGEFWFQTGSVGLLSRPSYFLKQTVFTRIDTGETSPANQGELLRVWDRSWRLRGWQTKILLPGEAECGLVVNYWWINFLYRPAMKSHTTRNFGDEEWATADIVKFRADTTEQQILECGRSLV